MKPDNAALKFRHLAEILRAEKKVDQAARTALAAYLAAVQPAMDNPQLVSDADEKWDAEVEGILVVLLSIFRPRYAKAGGRQDLLKSEWTKYAAQIRPYLDAVKNEVFRALQKGKPKLFEVESWRSKAQQIARTQTISAYNAGTFHGIEQYSRLTGETRTKTWLSVRDHRVRPTHAFADGQTVPLGTAFTVGGYMGQYPGSPELPAVETIGCRCVLVIGAPGVVAAAGGNMPWKVVKGGGTCSQDEWAVIKIADGSTAGCHGSQADAAAQVRALYAKDAQAGILPDGWRGPIAALDKVTGDGRMLMTPPDGLRTRQYPMSMTRRHVGETDIWIGTMDYAWVQDGELWGEGSFDLGGVDGQEAARQLTQGLETVSIQPDQVTWEEAFVNADQVVVSFDEATEVVSQDGEEFRRLKDGYQVVAAMTDWRLASVAVVSIPAYDEARIEPVFGYTPRASEGDYNYSLDEFETLLDAEDEELAVETFRKMRKKRAEAQYGDEGDGIIATITGNLSLPVSTNRDLKWDGHKARQVLEKWASSDGSGDLDTINWAKFGQAFLWRGKPGTGNSLADGQRVEDFKLPFAVPIDGKLTIVPNGVIGLAGGHGISATQGIPAADKKKLLSRLCTLYAKVRKVHHDFPACPYKPDSGTELIAAGGQVFASESFEYPGLDGPTPLTVTEDGRVYGHVALWGSCYMQFGTDGKSCTSIPKSTTGYERFHVHGARLADGSVLPVGALTFGEGHRAAGGLRASQRLYADVATMAAKVRAGEDEWGVWVAGEVLDSFRDQADDLLLSPLSGHWEPDADNGGGLEMLAAHVVVTPGFMVPRLVATIGDDGEIEALQASTTLIASPGVPVQVRVDEALDRLGIGPTSRAKAALERLGVLS